MARQVSPAHIRLGRAVRELRETAGLSQEALADLADVHRNYVGGVERGERNPTYTILLRLASALRVKTSRLIELAERRSK